MQRYFNPRLNLTWDARCSRLAQQCFQYCREAMSKTRVVVPRAPIRHQSGTCAVDHEGRSCLKVSVVRTLDYSHHAARMLVRVVTMMTPMLILNDAAVVGFDADVGVDACDVGCAES